MIWTKLMKWFGVDSKFDVVIGFMMLIMMSCIVFFLVAFVIYLIRLLSVTDQVEAVGRIAFIDLHLIRNILYYTIT